MDFKTWFWEFSGNIAEMAGRATRVLAKHAFPWVCALAAGFHLAYLMNPPAYYSAIHGDVASARWVSAFATPLFFFASYAYTMWWHKRLTFSPS